MTPPPTSLEPETEALIAAVLAYQAAVDKWTYHESAVVRAACAWVRQLKDADHGQINASSRL